MNIKMKNITTTLPQVVLSEMEKVSKDLDIAKNEIIVRSFELWNKKRKQSKLIDAYIKMANDSESKFFAEAGMSDFNKTLEAWER
jgi:hypothetical protein